MTILGDIIQDLATDKLVEQVHMICQRIKEEEQVSFEYIEYASEGPNIFLTLEVPGRNKKEVGFLSLEREGEEIYLSIYSTLSLTDMKDIEPKDAAPPKRQRVWEIRDHRAEKILTEFAKHVKFLRGE